MRIKGGGEQLRREGKCRIKQDERRETKSVEVRKRRENAAEKLAELVAGKKFRT